MRRGSLILDGARRKKRAVERAIRCRWWRAVRLAGYRPVCCALTRARNLIAGIWTSAGALAQLSRELLSTTPSRNICGQSIVFTDNLNTVVVLPEGVAAVKDNALVDEFSWSTPNEVVRLEVWLCHRGGLQWRRSTSLKRSLRSCGRLMF